MNYNGSDLKEQLNIPVSGPSKSSRKTKNIKLLWDVDDTELGNSLVNLNQKNDVFSKNYKDEKKAKYKIKSNVMYKPKTSKTSTNENIKQLLADRLNMYNTAEENARKAGEIKKVRRLNRKIQILNALIAHHDSGNIIDPDNIPPEIKINKNDSVPSTTPLGVTFKESAEVTVIPRNTDMDSDSSSETGTETTLEKIMYSLRLRRDQYKISVAQNKSAGNVPRALEHLNIVKMFDSVIRHLEMGEKVDLNELPGPPECPLCHINVEQKDNKQGETQNSSENISVSSIEEQIISHGTILQALQERLRAYEIERIKLKKENNVGQVLRTERIIKIYKDAIRLHKARKSFPIHDLPSPPGFAPIVNLTTTKTLPSDN